MHTKTELTAILREREIRLRKRLGQHYLVDPNTCRKLVSLCELSPEDTVIGNPVPQTNFTIGESRRRSWLGKAQEASLTMPGSAPVGDVDERRFTYNI